MLELASVASEGKETCVLTKPQRIFTFRKPPTAAWWRKKHALRKQTADLCYLLQHKISQGNINYKGKRYLVYSTQNFCGDLAGIGVSTFERARKQAVEKGLISYEVHLFGEKGEGVKRHLFIRPTDLFLLPFGVTLNDYDTWGRLHNLKKGRPKKGEIAPSDKIMSPDEIAACERWDNAVDRLPEPMF